MDPIPTGFDWKRAHIEHRDYLPHVRQDNVIYFVTFRLRDSLPAERVYQLKQKRDAWLRQNPPPHTREQKEDYRRNWTARIENLLDAGYGECILREPRFRSLLEASLRHHDGVKYRLGEFVIMPNHVHALVHLLPGFDLGETIKAWKSVSARQIGKIRQRPGSLWMEEYFDHAVRDEQSMGRFVAYIRRNPQRLPEGDYSLGSGTMSAS